MKSLLLLVGVGLLAACSSSPVMRTSIDGIGYTSAPTSASDPRLGRPQFYRDESDSMPWLNDAPRANR